MKIKRYFAPDIRQAMRMVREEQGPDAVILSNRRVEGGVEIVAALDFDEQALHEKLAERAAAAAEPPKPASGKPVPPPVSLAAEPRTASPKPSAATAELLARLRQGGGDKPEPAPQPATGRPAAAAFAKPSTAPSFPDSAVRAKPAPRPAPQAPMAAEIRRPAPPLPESATPSAAADGDVLAEIRREVRQLRQVMDLRLAEAGWQAAGQANATRLELLRGLRERGFAKSVAVHLANRLGGLPDADSAWLQAKEVLARQLPVVDDSLLEYGGVAALVGPTGVGKTTTVAKLAAKFRLKHGPRQLALITVDNYRIAAHEQLYTYGRILDVPVAIASDAAELQQALQGFLDKKLVLIDTAGMGQHDQRLAEQLALLKSSRFPIKPYLVLSAAGQLRALEDVVRAFGECRPEAAILTKLDEAAQPGAALSVLMKTGLPLSFVADGQQVPEALHPARAADLVEHCFNIALDDEEGDNRSYAFDEWVAHGGR